MKIVRSSDHHGSPTLPIGETYLSRFSRHAFSIISLLLLSFQISYAFVFLDSAIIQMQHNNYEKHGLQDILRSRGWPRPRSSLSFNPYFPPSPPSVRDSVFVIFQPRYKSGYLTFASWNWTIFGKCHDRSPIWRGKSRFPAAIVCIVTTWRRKRTKPCTENVTTFGDTAITIQSRWPYEDPWISRQEWWWIFRI